MSNDGTGSLDHVIFQLEQIETEHLSAAVTAYEATTLDEPYEALFEIGKAVGLAQALGRAWHGAGDGEKSFEFHERADHFRRQGDELMQRLRNQ